MVSRINSGIPFQQDFYQTSTSKTLDLNAICVFSALGFFLDDDTYYTNFKVDNSWKNNINWSYNPVITTLAEATNDFQELFENIIFEQTNGRKVILPLSGGLDSRTQAVALKRVGAEVSSFSYYFENGFREDKIAEQLAGINDFDFRSYKITKGYLWDKLDDLLLLNEGYTDFTHPRQMDVLDEISDLGEIFSLGHWGDVLFDSDPSILDYTNNIYEYLAKKLIKPGGLDLARDLWKSFDCKGNFDLYLEERIIGLWNNIDCADLEAKFRIFKSLYWAPRWTSVNLNIFQRDKPIALPYYDNRIIELSLRIPSKILRNRKVQIEYIKTFSPNSAKVVWQDQRPYNLFSYPNNHFPINLPFRILNKLKLETHKFFNGGITQRNWELQFLGINNDQYLSKNLFDSDSVVSKTLKEKYLNKFRSKPNPYNYHPLSMILTINKKLSE
jgi:hypothetical protein